MSPEERALVEAAREARESAHAPYSRFKVGAALRCEDGRIFPGCNVENVSYGLTICAERTALFAAVAAGYRPGSFTELAVIADTLQPVAPCGACRQVMLEIGGAGMRVLRANLEGEVVRTTAAALLPDAFGA